MKRLLENSSSGSDDDDVPEAFRAKRKQETSSGEGEEENHKQFKKVDVNLKKHVYEPVHFVRAHCKAGAGGIHEVDTQVRLFTHVFILVVLDGMCISQVLEVLDFDGLFPIAQNQNGCFVNKIQGLGC